MWEEDQDQKTLFLLGKVENTDPWSADYPLTRSKDYPTDYSTDYP